MPETVMRAPRFENVLGSGVEHETQTINLVFLGADKKKYTLAFSVVCAPITLAALRAHLGELLSKLPEKNRPPLQPVVVTAAQAIMHDNGMAGLELTLEGKAVLPLLFQSTDLAKLSGQFAELAIMGDKTRRH
jgi:hypothetical protein